MESKELPEEHIQEVQIGEEIFPFNNASFDPKHKTYESPIRLQIPTSEGIIKLPIDIRFRPVVSDGTEIIPFHPEEGYQITQEDLDPVARKLKIDQRGKEPKDHHPIAPNVLEILIEARDLINSGVADSKKEGDNIYLIVPPKIQSLLRSLKCVVNANGLYVANGNWLTPGDRLEDISFYSFYSVFPVDSGPLAGNDMDTFVSEDLGDGIKTFAGKGHHLLFSDDEQERKQIGIQFIIDHNTVI